MIINIADTEMLLSYTEEMATASFNADVVTNTDTIEFFKDSLDAKEYCLVMSNDADYIYEYADKFPCMYLKMVLENGIDTSFNEAFDLTG